MLIWHSAVWLASRSSLHHSVNLFTTILTFFLHTNHDTNTQLSSGRRFASIPSIWGNPKWPNSCGKHCDLLKLIWSYFAIIKNINQYWSLLPYHPPGLWDVLVFFSFFLLTKASCLQRRSFALAFCTYSPDLISLVICSLKCDAGLCHTNLNTFDVVRCVAVCACPFERGTNLSGYQLCNSLAPLPPGEIYSCQCTRSDYVYTILLLWTMSSRFFEKGDIILALWYNTKWKIRVVGLGSVWWLKKFTCTCLYKLNFPQGHHITSYPLINTLIWCIHLILGKLSSDSTMIFHLLIPLNFNKSTAGAVNRRQNEQHQCSTMKADTSCSSLKQSYRKWRRRVLQSLKDLRYHLAIDWCCFMHEF